jgi:hypothetical protein
MNKLNIKNLLTAIQNMIMRNRVAYKDYLGKETVVKSVLLASGLANGDNVGFNLTEGQSYDIDFGDERITLTAKCRECDDSFPKWASTTPFLDNFQDNYVLSGDISTWPTNSFCVCVHSGTIYVICTGEYVNKTLSIYRNDQTTKNKYDIKLLPEDLLPKGVANKKDIDRVSTAFNAQMNSVNNRINSLGDRYVYAWSSQNFSDVEKAQARENIGASDFSGNFGDLVDAPCLYKLTRTKATTPIGHHGNVRNGNSAPWNFIMADKEHLPFLTEGTKIQIQNGYSANQMNFISPPAAVKTIEEDGVPFQYVGNLYMLGLMSFVYGSAGGWSSLNFPTGYPKDRTNTGEKYILITSEDKASYFYTYESDGQVLPDIYTVVEEIEPLDDRLLANNIQRVGSDLIINSSTEGSTKKFKLVVNDSGEVSATEITG